MEEIRQQAFAHEKNFERKIVICRLEEFWKMNSEQRKAVVILLRFLNGKKGPVIKLRATGVRFFVSKYMYWYSRLNFLCGLKFIKEINPRTELGLDIRDTNIHEFALQITNSDYWKWLSITDKFVQEKFWSSSCLFSSCSESNKKIFRPPNFRFLYGQLQQEFKKSRLITNKEKKIKTNYFDVTKTLNILQDPFFIYDRSALVKQSFITELNKFLPI